jgi:hypothetical protein
MTAFYASEALHTTVSVDTRVFPKGYRDVTIRLVESTLRTSAIYLVGALHP